MEGCSFIPTKAAASKRKNAIGFERVAYETYKSPASQKEPVSSHRKRDSSDKKGIDMKKVRFEVFKFGMSGLKPGEHEEVKVALAVKLGAKPPKNPYVNYKELKTLKKKQVSVEEMSGADRYRKKRSKRPTAEQRRKGDVLDAYGKPTEVVSGKRKIKRRHK